MRPINEATGKKWSEANAQRMYKAIRTKALKALTARDAERGIPQPTGQVYLREDGSTEEDETASGRFVVDRHLADLKHTGRELRLLTAKKWNEFCASRDKDDTIIRRDEDAYVAAFNEIDNEAEAKQRKAVTAAAPNVEVEMPTPATVKASKATGTAVATK